MDKIKNFCLKIASIKFAYLKTKLLPNIFSYIDVTQMLQQMKTLLIDVVVEKSLPDASRIKLKDCISMVETFSNFLNNNLKKQEQNSDNLLKPLHSGLSRSTECLHAKKGHMSKSRSTSDLTNFDLVSEFTCSKVYCFIVCYIGPRYCAVHLCYIHCG